jgi:hypothetical protein
VNVRGPKVQYIVWFAPKRAPVSPLLSTMRFDRFRKNMHRNASHLADALA